MLRRMRARVAVVALILVQGCLWRGYARVLEIHLEVLDSMAAKMCGLTGGPAPASETIGEFVYPAKRAREVEQQFASRREQSSYAAFDKVLQRYEALLQLFDRSRVNQETWAASAERVCEESRAVSADVVGVRQALAHEG